MLGYNISNFLVNVAMAIQTKSNKIVRMVRSSRGERDKMMNFEIWSSLGILSDFETTTLACTFIALNHSLANRF